ncbi:MAG TPA: 2-dehydropantoate 2-reductase [Ilumatobacter sp.]|nr:2-dehydropantoate 2-reductase [Ilumatobacter sp.]
MRIVIVGVGAVGGTVAARLVLAGHDVLAVARGAHGAAIREHGLRFESPTGAHVVALPVVGTVAEVAWQPDDVVALAVKSQDTTPVLDELRLVADPDTPIVCLQNGVDNERQALRLFPNVYGVCVMLPADHLEPGSVRVYTDPPGLLDIGRYPGGTDPVTDALAATFESAGFGSIARPDVMRWKYRKLLLNLGNAAEALLGPFAAWPGPGDLIARVSAEGEAVLAAAGVDVVPADEDAARRGDTLRLQRVGGERRQGGSTTQSLQRGMPVETDFLNGEIVLLGRLHGVPTPANALLQRLMAEAAARRELPAQHTEAELLELLEAPGQHG